jgi:cell division protein ZapA
MAIETVRIEMLGTSFTIQTDESREYIDSILAYLHGKIDTVVTASRVEDPLKAAILAGVYLVDELFRERVDNTVRTGLAMTDRDEISVVTERLIARIDDTLGVAGLPASDGVPANLNGDNQ